MIDDIYEAGALPAKWPETLDRLSRFTGATAGMMLAETLDGLHGYESQGLGVHRQDYIDEGWAQDTVRIDWLKADRYPGFRTDLDFVTQEELARIPLYAEFLIPRGLDAGAATLISGIDDDQILVSIEAFSDHDAARAALPVLDQLRPHLARAAMLSARLRQSQTQSSVAALELAGITAAMLGESGRVRAANDRFETFAGNYRGPKGGHNIVLDRRITALLDRIRAGEGGGSVPIAASGDTAIAHLLPVRGAARDIFAGCIALLIITEPGAVPRPDQALIRLLYDLTPAEARVAAAIAEGLGVAGVATREGIAIGTVRAHLKAIYAKTGTHGQTGLALAITRLQPSISAPRRV